MKRLLIAAAAAALLAATAARADEFVPPTIDKPTYDRMMEFFRSTPMPYDVSSPTIQTLQGLEYRALAQKRDADAAAKAAAAKAATEPAKPSGD
jgi:hypothetical protein